MNEEFVRSIENPERLQLQRLQENARQSVVDRLEEYEMPDVPAWVVRKLTYTYYHDWKIDDPEYVFLLEDPGLPGEHVIMEMNEHVELGENYDPHEAIQIDRRFGARWLATKRYTDFTAQFIAICEDNGLIAPTEPWWRYLLSERFFDDFYMTDVIKYREANPGSGDINTAFSSHLIHELEYVEPDLIFAFGKRAWETVRDQLGADPITKSPDSLSVRDVHGILHETDRLIETMILPVGHPSTNFRGAQLPHEEYMVRLRNGLEQLTEETE